MASFKEKASMLRALGKIVFVDFTASRISAVMKKAFPGTGQIVLLDLDETLLKTSSSFELLVQVGGQEFARERYNYYRGLVKSGKKSFQDAMIIAYTELAKTGVNKRDYQEMVERVISEGKIRKDVLEAAKYLQRIGRTVLLVTKSSQEIANIFAKRFGFSGAIGTIERFDAAGKLAGIERAIGDKRKRRGVIIETKMDRVKEWCKERGVPFSLRRISLLSDSYDDVLAFRKSGFGVLYVPKEPVTHQKIAEKFRLRDYAVYEASPIALKQMKLALRFPKAALRVPKRLSRRTHLK